MNLLRNLVPFAIAAIVMAGLLADIEFLRNLSIGMAWLSIVGDVLVVSALHLEGIAGDPVRDRLLKRPRWRKAGVALCDIAIAMLLAGNGWWLTFAAWVTSQLLEWESVAEIEKQSGADGSEPAADSPQ